MRFSDGWFVWMQDDFSLFIVDMQSTQKQDQSRKGRVTWYGFQPVIYCHPTLENEEIYRLCIPHRKDWKGPSAVASPSNGRINKWDCQIKQKHTRIRSPNFSIFIQAWKGSCNSLPLITIFGKSSRWTSRGSRWAINKNSYMNTTMELTQHSLSSDDDLFWLLLNRKRTDEGGNFFGRFPFSQLTKPFLSSPNASVNDLQE